MCMCMFQRLEKVIKRTVSAADNARQLVLLIEQFHCLVGIGYFLYAFTNRLLRGSLLQWRRDWVNWVEWRGRSLLVILRREGRFRQGTLRSLDSGTNLRYVKYCNQFCIIIIMIFLAVADISIGCWVNLAFFIQVKAANRKAQLDNAFKLQTFLADSRDLVGKLTFNPNYLVNFQLFPLCCAVEVGIRDMHPIILWWAG